MSRRREVRPQEAQPARRLSSSLSRLNPEGPGVESSGFRSELWSYAPRGDQIVAIRYGSGADVQLWSTTDLAVQFALSQIRR